MTLIFGSCIVKGKGIYVPVNRDLTEVLRFKGMLSFNGTDQRFILLMVHSQTCNLSVVHSQFSQSFVLPARMHSPPAVA